MNPNELIMSVQFSDKYARQSPDGTRETWQQAVNRSVNFLRELSDNRLSEDDYRFIESMILEKKAMPSMRLLAMAGEASRRSHITTFNCSYTPVDSLIVFREAVLILMSGTGLGYSVEQKYVSKLPSVKSQGRGITKFRVPDTTEGWAEAAYRGIESWMNGLDVQFDLSHIRPEGTPLKIKGGIASGPNHLQRALESIRGVILSRQGDVLRPLDCHDIICHIADAVVSGGVRRSAAIVLFDHDDNDMLTCKSGDFPASRWNANNSMVISDYQPLQFWQQYVQTMHDSQRGEPGIFSRYAIAKTTPERRKLDYDNVGTNP